MFSLRIALRSNLQRSTRARAFASAASVSGQYFKPTTTLHTTNKVHSLGHQHENIPNNASDAMTGSEHSGLRNSVWCVAGASGQTKTFGDVPMGAFAVSQRF